jgi:hypothetical protein
VLPSGTGLLFLELLVARPISGDCVDKMQKQIADLPMDRMSSGRRLALAPFFGGIEQ